MTQPFYPGDVVRRLKYGHASIPEWGTGTVIDCTGTRGGHWRVRLAEDAESYPEHLHSPENLELVTRKVQTTETTGRKDDGGKLDMTLLDDMPRAIEAVVGVMQWAVTNKQPVPYARGSWLGVHADRYRAAIRRHDSAAAKQVKDAGGLAARFQPDAETKMLHLAHAACSALMALENTLREIEDSK